MRSLPPRILTVLIAVLTLVVTGLVSPARAAAAENSVTVGTRTVEVTFNNPLADSGGVDWAHHNKLIRLIDDAPAGSEIRIGLYLITRDNVVAAIQSAAARGVDVYVVADGSDDSDTAQRATLASALGARMRVCGSASTGGGCLSNSADGHMHAKYMMLSQTKDNGGTLRNDVVWVSSANMTKPSGAEQFNNSVTVYDDATLYGGFMTHVWNPMWARLRNYPNNDYYVASMPRGYFGSADSNSTVFVSPEQTTDLVLNRLNNIQPDSSCRIRVIEASIYNSRSAVVDKLVSLKNSGCKVWAMVGKIDGPQLTKLKNAGISVHKGAIHDKMILISEQSGSHTWVLVGSHNLTNLSLQHEDNILMRLEDSQPLYDAFYAHFNDAYNNYPNA